MVMPQQHELPKIPPFQHLQQPWQPCGWDSCYPRHSYHKNLRLTPTHLENYACLDRHNVVPGAWLVVNLDPNWLEKIESMQFPFSGVSQFSSSSSACKSLWVQICFFAFATFCSNKHPQNPLSRALQNHYTLTCSVRQSLPRDLLILQSVPPFTLSPGWILDALPLALPA